MDPSTPDVAAPEVKPHGDGAPGAADETAEALRLTEALEEQLADLETDEQQMLAEFLRRAKRDRAARGPLDELSMVANGLKTQPATDDWQVFMEAKEKIGPPMQKAYPGRERIPLPQELVEIEDPLSSVIQRRSSRRSYTGAPLSLDALSTLLFLGYGARDTVAAYNKPNVPVRTVPTTGGLQCVELYFVANAVEGLEQGLYHYHATDHILERLECGVMRWKVVETCQDQEWIANASIVFFLAPNVSRISWKYRRRSYRMAHIDGGIVGHNLHLVATSLGLGSCLVTGCLDDEANYLLDLDGRAEATVLALPVGQRAECSVR